MAIEHTLDSNRKAALNESSSGESGSSSKAWRVLSAGLPPMDGNSTFWWQTSASYLGTALEQAGYEEHDQYDGLLYYYRFILPYLGDRPTPDGRPKTFQSFITDDFSPFELSWSWGGPNGKPIVRFLIEAIGSESGTKTDPYNQKRTLDLVRSLQQAKPDIDWQWFDHFFKTLLISDNTPIPTSTTPRSYNPFSSTFWSSAPSSTPSPANQLTQLGHRSSVFLAFDLQRGRLLVKPYFLALRAIQTGQSPLSILAEGVRSFPHSSLSIPALDQMLSFASENPEGAKLEWLAIAPDCISPEKSRLKIYARSPNTSFDSVRAIMSLGGQFTSPEFLSSLAELRKFWQLVLSLPADFSDADELCANDHMTSGILYNLDIKPGNAMPETKIYIPAKHYSANDLEAARGVTGYLSQQGKGGFADGYMQTLRAMTTHRRLDEGSDLQTYIGVAFRKGGLELSNYLSPAIHHAARWRKD